MSHELHYTSASRGLKPGTHGFCTVAATANLEAPVAERLEGLSGYRPAFPPGHPSARLNPAVVSHLKLNLIGRSFHILSRVGEAGLDYSGRGNKYAHHVALEGAERPAGGPAWLAGRRGFLDESWSGEPRVLPKGRPAPPGDQAPAVCRAWARRFGDAGWAGVVADLFLTEPNRPVYFFFDPGEDLLPLFAEAIALLPVERRWDVSFSTYYTGQAQGLTCLWRGVVRDSPEAEQARRLPGVLVLDPLNPPGTAPGGILVEQARTGIAPSRPNEPAPRAASRPAGAPRTTSADSTREPRNSIDEPSGYGLFPTAGPVPRRPRPSRRVEGLDKAQVATWVGVGASLIFLVGASAAWYRSQAKPDTMQAAAEADKPSDLEAGPDSGDPPAAGLVATSRAPAPPLLRPATPRKSRASRDRSARVPDPPPPPPPPPRDTEPGAPGPADPDRLRKMAEAPASPPSNQAVAPSTGPAGGSLLKIWDIQTSDTLTPTPAASEIDLLPLTTEKNLESLEFKQDDTKRRISVRYKEEFAMKDLATVSLSPERTVVLKLSESSEGEKTTRLVGLLGNSVLKVGSSGAEPEYYLLQKPLKLSKSIVLARHLSREMIKPRVLPLLLKDQRGVDLPKIEFGECWLRPSGSGPATQLVADLGRSNALSAKVGSPPGAKVALRIVPEAQEKRGELYVDVEDWSPKTWEEIRLRWRDRPAGMGQEYLADWARGMKGLVLDNRKAAEQLQGDVARLELFVDDILLFLKNEQAMPFAAEVMKQKLGESRIRVVECKKRLAEQQKFVGNLEVIERTFSVIGDYRLDLALFVTTEGAERRRFQLPLEPDELPLPPRPAASRSGSDPFDPSPKSRSSDIPPR